LLAPAAPSRSAYIDRQVAALHVYGSKPEWLDDDAIRARAARAYDRCFCPEGVGRQMTAIMRDGSRSAELAELRLPTLVIHGSRDTLVDPSGGRRTAEVIPGARYLEIDGMGHDYPPAVWREWVAAWSAFARAAVAGP
jgi:pimeloyl-ACP methyl ester carboxylesterase